MPLRFLPKQKLALATILYWFLLLYIIAALLFWYIRLQEQSSQMANYRLMELVADDPQYLKKVEQINEESIRKQRFPDRNWILEIPDSIHLKADPLLIQILINNLLDNAVKYSPRSASVQVKLVQGTSSVEMSIADQGPGIPDEEKGKIFKRFYRIGNESVRTTQGTGLGLYLCKKITTDHRGSIRVSDNQPSGANFIVQLPNN